MQSALPHRTLTPWATRALRAPAAWTLTRAHGGSRGLADEKAWGRNEALVQLIAVLRDARALR